jgi:mono/diheme cytochrome c family protein
LPASISPNFQDRAADEHDGCERTREGSLMHRHLRQICLPLTVALSVGASPALAADPGHGADLAKRWCASCHVVANGQVQASADVPSFASVARRPDFSPERLAFFLLDPHPKMPNFPLSRTEAGDIAAYIGSLR